MKSEIFEEYCRKYPDCDVNDDGVVNEQLFAGETLKCLGLLKETNEFAGSLKDFLKEGAPEGGMLTWQPFCKWMEALLDGTMELDYKTAEERSLILNRIGTFNLKKVAGAAVSNGSYVSFARENKDLLLKQLLEIPYNVVILCCDDDGNKFIEEELLLIDCWYNVGESDLQYGYTKEGKLAINARHPNRSSWHYTDSFWLLNKMLKEGKISLSKKQ